MHNELDESAKGFVALPKLQNVDFHWNFPGLNSENLSDEITHEVILAY